MSFIRENFSLISSGFSGSTPRIWAYDTQDEYTAVLDIGAVQPKYFTEVRDQVNEGDIINIRFSNFPEAPLTLSAKVEFIDQTPLSDEIKVIPQSCFIFSARFPDISTASSIFIPIPVKLHIVQYQAVISGPITGADAGLVLNRLFVGGIVGSNLNIIQSSSAAGDLAFTYIPTDPTRVIEGDSVLEVLSDGASTGVVSAQITIVGL